MRGRYYFVVRHLINRVVFNSVQKMVLRALYVVKLQNNDVNCSQHYLLGAIENNWLEALMAHTFWFEILTPIFVGIGHFSTDLAQIFTSVQTFDTDTKNIKSGQFRVRFTAAAQMKIRHISGVFGQIWLNFF